MLSYFRKFGWLLFTGLWVTAVAAQAECPAIVQSALDATDTACQMTGRNQACYGNVRLSVDTRDGSPELDFDAPGDMVDVASIRGLTLEPLNATDETWGIALMQLQADLPDSVPGQNVTVLVFGDVAMTGAETGEATAFEVVTNDVFHVRSAPSMDAEPIAGLEAGQAVLANGRIEDGSWLRIELDSSTIGWIAADAVTSENDTSLLSVVDPAEPIAPALNPLQAFYFRTGIGDAPCSEAPDSGILIQTPEGVGTIHLTINEVQIELGSTLYLQTLAADEIAINVVEHQATVSAQGVSQFVPAGSRVRVTVDENRVAIAPPSAPEPYDNADLAALPV
jgi:uncharacterized protein YgiM (DUF1202 family)